MSEYATGLDTGNYAVVYAQQNKILRIKGLWWIIIGDGTYEGGGIFALTTRNFTTFTSFKITTVGTGFGRAAAWDYDENADVLHVVTCAFGVAVKYRAGTPETDGTITWLAAEQTPDADTEYAPNIRLDSNGFPWITYYKLNGAVYDCTVLKSSTKDGTWTTDATITKVLFSQGNPSWSNCTLVKQTDGKMYFVYDKGDGTIMNGWQYDSGWAVAEDVISATTAQQAVYDAVPEDDDIHMVFQSNTTVKIIYQKLTYGTGWSAETEIETGVTVHSATISLDAKGRVYIHFMEQNDPSCHRWIYKNAAWTQLSNVTTTSLVPTSAGDLHNVVGQNVIIFQDNTSKATYIIAYAVTRPETKVITCGI